MDEEVCPLEKEHSLSVLLPGGIEENTTVHGSKPVMDLLVTLCASYHLNPSDYTVEVLSPSKNNITFTPNSPIGSLEAETIVLKPKASEEEKVQPPYMPEATVRLLINYNKSHKAVVRVSPRVPLETLLPTVCDKCEFQVESTVLLRDLESTEGLDLGKTLNELGIREVYAKDTRTKAHTGYLHLLSGTTSTKVASSSSLQDLTKKEKKKSENKGFLSLFRKHRKKSEPTQVASAPSSPGPSKSRSASVSAQDASLCSSPTADLRKKRRASQPPLGACHSFPTNLSSCHIQPSGENTLRSTKRRAPPPPPPAANPLQEVQDDTMKDCLNPLEEERESVECESVDPSPSPSAAPPPSPPAPPHENPDPQRPPIQAKDLSDARAALAKVLTASLSSGSLLKRLKNTNSSPFPKANDDTSSVSSTETNSDTSTEDKSVLNSNLPDDPANKTGLTTFKVVPSRRESDAEPTQDVPAKEETDDEPQTVEQLIPETEHSVNGENSTNQSESSSPVPCPDEGEASSCTLVPDHQDEDEETAETVKQDDTRLVSDVEAEVESGQSHESVTNEGDLYLGEAAQEKPTDLNACDSETCNDRIEEVAQEEDGFPPPPPPVCFSEYQEGPSVSGATRAVTNGHVRSHSEPPQTPPSPGDPEKAGSGPNRFAQAVALAVQRSRLHSTGKP